MRRPLCAGLLIFLCAYLTAFVWLPKWRAESSPGIKTACDEAAACGGTAFDGEKESLAGMEVLLIGKAADPYEPAGGSQKNKSFTLKNFKMLSAAGTKASGEIFPTDEKSGWKKEYENVLCYLKEGENLPLCGSIVKVEGILTPFVEATNPGEFDMASYYERRGYAFSLKKVRIVEQGGEYDRFEAYLHHVRTTVSAIYARLLGKENGSIASAMVMGIKKGLDPEIKELYQNAGISHLLAISGLHISMIGMGFFTVLKKLRFPFWTAAAAAISFLLFYGKMVGMSVSTKRAILMFAMLLAAQSVKRTADVLTSLTVAACVILLPDPDYVTDAGFQLSFMAVAGAAIVVPVLQERGIRASGAQRSRFKQLEYKLYDGVAASAGITLFMLPAMLHHYYKWNPWSVAANLIVIPLMGVLLLLLLALAGTGLLLANSAAAMEILSVAALPAKGIFYLYRQICRLTALMPGSSLHTGEPKLWQLIFYAAGLAAFIRYGKKVRPSLRLCLAALLTCVFLLRTPGNLQITMLDTGQGESVCVETPSHQIWLLDAGSTSKSRTGQYQIIPFLEYGGVRKIAGILVSHWDEDHVNALEEIFSWAKAEHVKIGSLSLPDIALEDEGKKKLLALAQEYKIPVQFLGENACLQSDGVKFTCLHPYTGETVQERNNTSLVMKLQYGDFTALFTGDLEEEKESWLVDRYGTSLSADLLDAGHHGSANASSTRFLDMVSPQAALISCGRNNRYGHPAEETMERFEERSIQTYVTSQCGAITVTVLKDGMTIRPFLY